MIAIVSVGPKECQTLAQSILITDRLYSRGKLCANAPTFTWGSVSVDNGVLRWEYSTTGHQGNYRRTTSIYIRKDGHPPSLLFLSLMVTFFVWCQIPLNRRFCFCRCYSPLILCFHVVLYLWDSIFLSQFAP